MRTNRLTNINTLLFAGLMICVILISASAVFAGGGPNVNGAKLYIKQNNLDQAFRVLEKELKEVDPNNEDAWYLLGYLHARKKDYDKMLEAFNKAEELEPDFKEEGIKISGDKGTQFRSEFGTTMIKKVVWGSAFNQGVQNFNAGINAADEASKIESYEKAIEGFKTAAMLMPDSLLAYRNMAAAYLNLGEYEKSVQPLEEALKRAPNDTEVKIMLAQVHMNNGADSLAVPLLEELWEGGVQTKEVAETLSRAYVRNGNFDKAEAIYDVAIKENPDDFHFRYNFGTILLEGKKYDEAIEQLKKAYEIDSSSADVNYNLGAAYLNRGVDMREELPEDSEDESFKEDFKMALPYLEKSISMNPDPNTWFTLGRIYGQLNKIASAGYAFSKGDEVRTALEEKVMVGMETDLLKTILGEPDEVTALDSKQFKNVEEWTYRKRTQAQGKIAIPEPLNVYVNNGKVDALMVVK